jgi:hypothetical protein
MLSSLDALVIYLSQGRRNHMAPILDASVLRGLSQPFPLANLSMIFRNCSVRKQCITEMTETH